MASTVTLKYGDFIETIPLFDGRLHIPTIKDAFTLRVARIDGVLAPVDNQGFTHAIFKPGDTLNISGTSAEGAAMSGTLHSRFRVTTGLCITACLSVCIFMQELGMCPNNTLAICFTHVHSHIAEYSQQLDAAHSACFRSS